MNIFCVVYLNNILIYFKTLTEYEKHVKQVLKRLWSFQLYVNLKKCEFSTTKIEFLEFIIFTEDVVMNLWRVEVIKDWSESKTFWEVQVFLDFANFYQCFIHCYSQIAASLMNLIKESKNDKKSESFNFSLSIREVFIKLWDTFTCASILIHYDSALHIWVEINTSIISIVSILSQLLLNAEWHSVTYWSQKLISAETRYETHD